MSRPARRNDLANVIAMPTPVRGPTPPTGVIAFINKTLTITEMEVRKLIHDPIAIMPGWLQVIARLNPLSYQVDALRTMMVAGGVSTNGLGLDFAVTLLVTTALIALGARLYPQIVQ